MTQDELKLVLEALKWCHGGEPCGTAEAIAVVEKALAQTQEPVAWYHAEDYKTHFTTNPSPDLIGKYWKPLYTHPPQRKPLTIGDVKIIWQNLDVREGVIMGLVRAVEAAHDIKENT
jgi:hypothetical protein